MLTGTIVNAAAILAGSAVGLLIKWLAGKFSGSLIGANNLGLRLQDIIMKGVALCVLYIGMDGLTGDHTTLFAKSLLDGISAIVFSSSLGIGVAFSAVAVLLYQGLIALMASFISPFLGDAVIAEMTCVGSLLIAALALNMLGITKIKVMNLVPACILPIFLCMVM